MKVINSQDYNNIDDFFNDFNECVRAEKNYKHLLHYNSKNIELVFHCNFIEYNISSFGIYKDKNFISSITINNIKTINFWFVSYQE